MRFEEFLNALPTNVDRFCHEIKVRTIRERIILLKKLLRSAFDAGRYNDPTHEQTPAPFLGKNSQEYYEQEKWSRLWRSRDLRMSVASDQLQKEMVAALECYGSAGTLIDFGCGCGLALKFFQELEFDVFGIDIASNALNEELASRIPLLRACLWNLPDSVKADHGYCVNVMEHIPESKITEVICNISCAVRRRTFFQMQTAGSHKDAEFWQKHFGPYFRVKKERKDYVQFIVG